MKNKIFLSITMLVSMSSYASNSSQAPMQDAPLLLIADQFKQAAIEFVFKLAANQEVQENLKQIFAKITDDISNLAETSPSSLALRKDFDVLLGSLKGAALDTIKTHEKELTAIGLKLINNLLERSKEDIDKIKKDSKSLFSEISKGLKPQLKAVMQELTKLYSSEDKSYPTAGENPSNHDGYYLHDGSYHDFNKK